MAYIFIYVLFTGELIGLEYLYSQSSGCSSPVPYQQSAQAIEEEEDTTLEGEEGDADINEDEGFEEMPSVEDFTIPSLTQQEKLLPAKPILQIPSDEEYRSLLGIYLIIKIIRRINAENYYCHVLQTYFNIGMKIMFHFVCKYERIRH